MNFMMDSCNFLSSDLCTASRAFSRMDCSMGGFVFERNCPIVVRLRFWSMTRKSGTCSTFTVIVAKGARVSLCTFSFLLSTKKKSPCFLSTLTDFPLFLLLADVPVTVRSFLASKLRALTFWFRKISGSSPACPSEECLGHTRQQFLELIRLANLHFKKCFHEYCVTASDGLTTGLRPMMCRNPTHELQVKFLPSDQ